MYLLYVGNIYTHMSNSNYKGYLLRQLGLKESKNGLSSKFNPNKNLLKGGKGDGKTPEDFDSKQLEMGYKVEREHSKTPQHRMEIAMDHLTEHPKYYNTLKKAGLADELQENLGSMNLGSMMLSPTAKPTPVIGVAVRGSSTGGLPSGADQQGNITPSNLGGYTKVQIDSPNSKLIDKTPKNSTINSTSPIANVTDTPQDGVEHHPHQVQNDANEPPQAVTGASTDSSNDLTLKSAMPKGLDIDVADESNNEDGTEGKRDEESYGKYKTEVNRPGMNETFLRHIQLMKEYIGIEENVGASEPFVKSFEMSKEKAGMVPVEKKLTDEKLESLQESLKAKSKTGVLSDKELQLSRRINAVKNIRRVNKQ